MTAATRPTAADPGTLVHERDTGRVLRWTGRDWVDDLPGWLGVQLDEVEQLARAATPGPWRVNVLDTDDSDARTAGWDIQAPGRNHPRIPASVVSVPGCCDQGGGVWERADAEFIAALDPSWRLADIARKRAIVAECVSDLRDREGGLQGEVGRSTWTILCWLAVEFADEPGYQPWWGDEIG